MMDKREVLDLPFNIASYSTFIEEIIALSRNVDGSSYVCVANVQMLIESYRSKEFRKQVSNADIVTPDGKPITWALRFLYGVRQDRVAGLDLLPDILTRCVLERLPVYFYCGTEEMLVHTSSYIHKYYPCLWVTGIYSPPFRTLSPKEEDETVDIITSSRARIVFVVLSCPKQEKWMATMKGRIPATMIGVGDALPVMIGMQKRSPFWVQQSGLEWLFQLLQDLKRLWKRHLVTNLIFLYLLLAVKIKHAKLKRKLVSKETLLLSFHLSLSYSI